MGLNSMPSGERTHIGFFGLRNAGKSSLVNAVCAQDVAVVSDTPGTTTDPVKRAMELLPLGPVVIVDTPGIDDVGTLGEQRVARAKRTLASCDLAVLVVDATAGMSPADHELVRLFRQHKMPYAVAWNKADLLKAPPAFDASSELLVSAKEGLNIYELKELIARVARTSREVEKHLVADLLSPGDLVLLVVPIDSSAPKGRLILPQQMVLRDILDTHAIACVCQPDELAHTMGLLAAPPRLVICDSQVFKQVAKMLPEELPLTSFSILMARYKGSLDTFVKGAKALAGLHDGSSVLISEGCTHHRQCEDIGSVKIPAWIRAYTGAEPTFSFSSGQDFPEDSSGYDLVVHCGGCTLNEREMARRAAIAHASGTPLINYGMAIAQMHGILERSLAPLMPRR